MAYQFSLSEGTSHVQITSTGTSDVKEADAPSGAHGFLISVATTGCYLSLDGTDASSTHGIAIPAGALPVLIPVQGNIKIVSQAAANSVASIIWVAQMGGLLTATSLAAGAGTSGIVVTDTPATYNDGLYTCSRLQVPAGGLVSPSQWWFALRVAPGFASTSVPGTPTLFSWWTSFTDGIDIEWGTGSWRLYLNNVGGGLVADSFSANQSRLICIYGDSSGTGINLNGGVFSTGATAPSFTSVTLFDIGSAGTVVSRPSDTNTLWFACGNGSLTQADTSTLNALGDTPPNLSDIPPDAQLTAVADFRSGPLAYNTPDDWRHTGSGVLVPVAFS